MRKAIIAGNWKMHYTPEEAVKVINELKPLVKDATCDVVVCPTFVCLDAVLKAVKGSNIKVAAQNMHFEEKGAFTGEISPLMLKELDMDYVVIGHSERRQYFNETDETVNKKVLKALDIKKSGVFAAGVLFGTAGVKILASEDAKKVYTNCTAAVLRAKTCVLNVAASVQANAEDILAEAQQINEERAAKAEAAAFADEAAEAEENAAEAADAE